MKNTVIKVTTKQLILFGIAIITTIIIVSALMNRADTSSTSDHNKSKIDSLNIELKYVRQRQNILDGKIKSYNSDLQLFDHKLDSLNQKLTETRTYYGKKIKDITSYGSTELNEFFSNRYK
jgi:peptidoglycan hydrolase CwlO-like protein